MSSSTADVAFELQALKQQVGPVLWHCFEAVPYGIAFVVGVW